jgi:excisionase family DNA binding protein
MKQYLTTREVAEMLGLKPITLKMWRMYGKGPSWQRIGTKAVRYPLSAVTAWLEANSKAERASSTLRTTA